MTMINKSIFRAYDIRGIATPTGKHPTADLTPETIKLIGLATGTYLTQKYSVKTMTVGRDNRLHSEALQNAFIEGILETGINVYNLGLSTSPLVYFSVCHSHYDSGVNITASHNPKEYNGVKIVRQHGHSVCDKELQEIYQIIVEEKFIRSAKPGEFKTADDNFNKYLEFVTKNIKLAKPMKVVVDCGNGVSGPFAPKLLREIGCEVIELYTELDGNFPNHEANPEEAHNMIELGQKVVEHHADFGLGFDGDGDRVGLVDENGKHYPAEYLLMLISRDFLKKYSGEKVIFDVKVSNNLINDIKNSGGIPIMSKTGHSFIEEKIRTENAHLAGENSGHIFFGEKYFNFYGFDDAMFAACKVIEIMSKSDKKFSQHFTGLPKLFSTPELKIYCPDDRKFEVVRLVKEEFLKTYDCITIDGVRVNFDINSWGAVRASNTTPCLTARFEADSEEKLLEIKSKFFAELSKFPEVKLPS